MNATTDQREPQTATGAVPDTRVAARLCTEILSCARNTSSQHGFWSQALVRIGRAFGSPYAALYARSGSEVIQEETHTGSTAPTFWRPAVQEFLTDSLADDCARAKVLSARNADLKIALLSAPFGAGTGGVSGAVAVVVRGGEAIARAHLQNLEAVVTLAASAVELVGATVAEPTATSPQAPAQALVRAASVSSPEDLAFALTNNLRAKLGCEQATLGLVVGRSVHILSISGLDDVNRRSPGVARLRAAMEECLDLGEPIVCQRDGGWDHRELDAGYRLHRQWCDSVGNPSVASIPLFAGGSCAAILSLRRSSEKPFRREQIDEIRAAVEPFAPALLLVKKAQRGMCRHAWESARDAVGALVGPGRLGLKLCAILTTLAAAWFSFGTLDYEVITEARVVPAEQRHIAAPFEGALASAEFPVGSVVRAGDVLCRLDCRELELERDRLLAQLALLERERMRALAADAPIEARLVEARQRLTQVQLDIVHRRIDQATCRAPFDGVIVSGDLRKRIGSVVAQGEPLFEIAPLDHWTLELEVPERVAAEFHRGMGGRFAGHARPEATQPFSLSNVRLAAEIRDGRNVFVAEADLKPDATWMRPGMEGVAKTHIGPRRVWWVTLHNVLDYLRLNFWL